MCKATFWPSVSWTCLSNFSAFIKTQSQDHNWQMPLYAMELYMGWLWYVFCIHMQPQSSPLAAFQQRLDSMVEFTNLFMPCAEHSINTSISMCISVIATRWPAWNLVQRTGRAETGWFSAEKPSKATLWFCSSWHQHYIALCPPLVVPLYLGRGLCSNYFLQIDAVVTLLQAVEAQA